MNSGDYDRFKAALEVCGKVYGHALDNAQVAFYWDCLEDRPIDDVEKRMKAHAQRGKFFPKPRDLRPLEAYTERTETDVSKDHKFQQGQAFNRETWRRALAADPQAAKLALCVALWARYSVESDPGSPVLAARREWLADRYGELGGKAENLTPPHRRAPGPGSV